MIVAIRNYNYVQLRLIAPCVCPQQAPCLPRLPGKAAADAFDAPRVVLARVNMAFYFSSGKTPAVGSIIKKCDAEAYI